MNDLAPHSASTAAPPPSGTERACHADVEKLYVELVDEGAEAERQGGASAEAAARWDAFQKSWKEAWQEVGTRCALGEDRRGPGLERMAWVHRSLPAIARKYRERLARFDRELAPDLAELRRALDKSRSELEDTRASGE